MNTCKTEGCESPIRSDNRSGYCTRTLECRANVQRAFRATEEGKRHVWAMNLKKYGITPEQYEEMHEAQGGLCASCGKPETATNQFGLMRLAVDHNHTTGDNRELLCMICNRVLGMIDEDPRVAEAIAAYIRRHQEV